MACPALRNGAAWTISHLQQQKRRQNLPGFGYVGVAIQAMQSACWALLPQGAEKSALGVFQTRTARVESACYPVSSRRLPD